MNIDGVFQLQPDDNYISSEWEKKINEARKQFKQNNAIVVSTKEKENEEPVILDEETINKVDHFFSKSYFSMKNFL